MHEKMTIADYVKGLDNTFYKITETYRKLLNREVIEDVAFHYFGHVDENGDKVVPVDDIRMAKIKQNVEIMTIKLLGMTIHRDDMLALSKQYSDKLIESVVSRGAAVGVEAGQSLVQPIIQAMLKTQHKTGNKQAIAGANSIEHLNKLKTNTNVVRVHIRNNGIFEQPDGSTVVIDHRYLSDRYEQIRMHDVLVSSMGNSKVEISHFDKSIYERTDVVFINKESEKPHRAKQPVYQFQVDPDKLGDAGITMIHVIQTLMLIKNVCFVVHPLSTFRFDMIKIDNSQVNDNQVIDKLEKTKIKGIDGLAHINVRQINPKEALALHRFEDDNGKIITRAYINMYYYTQIPLNDLRKMVLTKSSFQERKKLEETIAQAEDKENDLRKKLMNLDDNDEKLLESYINAQNTVNDLRESLDTFQNESAVASAESLDLKSLDTVYYFEYEGEVELSKQAYSYYYFHGDITIEDITKHLGKYMNHDYTVTNDPIEMISLYGRSIAVTQHELLYSEELASTDTDMHYQHISLICAYMFANQPNPISPSGYLKNKGVTALDRFAFEQYAENLGAESVKGVISNTKSITTSIFTGNRANIGTAYIKCRINQERRKEVLESYKIAYEEQLYDNRHNGIELPVFDKIVMRSDLGPPSGPFVNDINPF